MDHEEQLARSYRAHAEMLRGIAESSLTRLNRESFTKLAEHYDRLADTMAGLKKSRADIVKAHQRPRFFAFARAS